jgi:peptidylprolyl isomerase
MKSMFQFIAAIACVAALTACGGAAKTTTTTSTVVQPAFKLTETQVGTGTVAAAGDLVVINFVGYLYDSTKSDFKGAKVESSVDTGKPAAPFTVGVGAVVTGWDQSILGMAEGGKRTAILPANLAYGAAARDAITANGITYPAIPAYSPMVYDFELVTVTKATNPVVIAPPTTVKITDVVVGTGTTAATGNTVGVRYTGWIYDGSKTNFKGTQFDTNVSATDPLSFVVGSTSVITGFSTGVTGMLVGGSRTVIIPPDQAYGSVVNGSIPANSTLVFDITLVSVK